MSDLDVLVACALDLHVPLRPERAPAWDDVLDRASIRRPSHPRPVRGRRARRLVLALAVVAAAALVAAAVATALGLDVFSGLSSWLGGAPGMPASTAEQAGFMRRNGSSYASFPARTELRLLRRGTVHGRSFDLLGFRDGGSLCLRLVPVTAPSVRGVSQCTSLRELRRETAPALVASTASYPVRGGRVAALFGFADDTVRSVQVVRASGAGTFAVANNVFLALAPGPREAIDDPVLEVIARTRGGRTSIVPFTTSGALPRLGVSSYVRRAPVVFGGPRRIGATLPHPTIDWIDRRAARGESFTPNLWVFRPGSVSVVYGRRIQPDPDDPYRIGVSVLRVGRGSTPRLGWSLPTRGKSFRLRSGQLLLCYSELFPLRPAPVGFPCSPRAASSSLFEAGHVLTVSRMYREAFTRVSGLAADGVREVDLYLASGRVVPASLRDNAYTVSAPSNQWPAKLVAFDGADRALEIDLIDRQSSEALVTPCPQATVGADRSAAPPFERLDLATGTLGGHAVLGRRRDAVERALGPLEGREHGDLLYGRMSGGDPAVRIHFARRAGSVRAVWIDVRDQGANDARLGFLLRLQPPVLQRRIVQAYPAYREVFAYGSQPALLGCSGTFANRAGTRELAFGLDPYRPSQLFIRISDPRVDERRAR